MRPRGHPPLQTRANTCGTPPGLRTAAPAALLTPACITRAIRAARVHDVARRTPLERAVKLSERGHDVHLKREDLQPVKMSLRQLSFVTSRLASSTIF